MSLADEIARCPKCEQETLVIVDSVGPLIVILCDSCREHVQVTEVAA